jgi:5-methylcytosine-specific restriction endonuclease McrA
MLLPWQRWRCTCGKTLGMEDSTLEHVFPRRFMGPRRRGYTIARCFRCNHAKGDAWPTGCELIWLFAVNAWQQIGPTKMDELLPHLRRPPVVVVDMRKRAG